MLKFLFGSKNVAVVETQRQVVKRCVEQLNEILVAVDGAKINVTLNDGTLDIELPDQMPDEAKALPAPTDKTDTKPVDTKADKDVVSEAKTASKDTAAKPAKAPA